MASNEESSKPEEVQEWNNMNEVFEYMRVNNEKISDDDLKRIAAGISYRAAWKGLMLYENFHKKSCFEERKIVSVKLNQPVSVKAMIKEKLGFPVPFDRHDYTIDRCGKHHRYIVEFYAKDNDGNFEVDARPAFNGGYGVCAFL